ncbi:MAG: hypothetical protein PHR57_00945 [Patescibacteria group bacterium]|nr:hypothetical protein [Patescibacteria group bacterium]
MDKIFQELGEINISLEQTGSEKNLEDLMLLNKRREKLLAEVYKLIKENNYDFKKAWDNANKSVYNNISKAS